jgi:D-sedoheptulose 7-phosphate isomerase
MIKTVVFDIDGVFTDGKISIGEDGREQKAIDFRDIDGYFGIKRDGYRTAFITGEATQITKWFNRRFAPDYFFSGCKDKKAALSEILEKEKNTVAEICYIGDSKHDLKAFELAGLKVCPQNATQEVKAVCDIVLVANGGDGAIAELRERIGRKREPILLLENISEKAIGDHFKILRIMQTNSQFGADMHETAEIILTALKSGKKLLLCGNGGSAADSQHIATELISRFLFERNAFDAEALTINTSTLTAIGNDYSFDTVFSRQIEAKAKKGDVVLGITTSGTSKNIIKAFEKCKELGVAAICLTGNKTNPKLNELCDVVIQVPSESTPRIQEAHIMIGHILCEYIEKKLSEEKK